MANFNRQRGFIQGWSGERKLQGFNRDETYPLGVRFKTATGQKTQDFFMGREEAKTQR
jgi:hypothetical protein